jgi:hypothetical protein
MVNMLDRDTATPLVLRHLCAHLYIWRALARTARSGFVRRDHLIRVYFLQTYSHKDPSLLLPTLNASRHTRKTYL